MTVDRILPDAEFGHLYIKGNARAVRYTFRPANDGTPQCGILITVPRCFDVQDVLRSVEEMRTRLRQMLNRHQQQDKPHNSTTSHHIGWDFCIKSDCLHINIIKGTREVFSLHHEPVQVHRDSSHQDVVDKPAVLQVVCPPDCDFDAPGRQEWLRKVIEEGVRTHAKEQLIPRLKDYARLYDIQLHEVKINNSRGHWGSCVRHRKQSLFSQSHFFNINLSLFSLLLPLPVQRLILLHELTHTRHMDHSPAFHHDLDVWLGGKEKALEQELKRYSTDIFSFVSPVNEG